MKNLLTIFIFLNSLTAFTQVDITNISLTDPTQRILYLGVDNYLKINGIEIDSTFLLTAVNGNVRYINSNVFIVQPYSPGIDTVVIQKNNTVIYTNQFIVNTIPTPITRLGQLSDTFVTCKEILKNRTLNVILPNCFYKHTFHIVKFKVTFFNSKNEKLNIFETEFNNQLSKSEIKFIKKLNAGSQISFTEITVSCPDCTARILSNVTYTIK